VIFKEGRKYDSHDRESEEFLKCENTQQVKLPKFNWFSTSEETIAKYTG